MVRRIAIPIAPPITTANEPPVTAKALALRSDGRSIISGRPAESPASSNRLTPNATRINRVRKTPVLPEKINIAIKIKSTERRAFATKIARCLAIRSRIVPTNGPTTE